MEVLVGNWPKETNMEEFRAEKLEEGETWAKAENYFMQILNPPTMLHRLKVWQWSSQWEEQVQIVTKFYSNTKGMFTYIM